MGIFNAAGTRITKSTFPTAAVPAADVPKVVTEDLFITRRYDAVNDAAVDGSIKTILVKADAVLTQKQIDDLFPAAVISTVSPATGGVAGGEVVTITGENLDGVTSVTFGGTAGTALTLVSPTELTVTTPTKTAGAVTVAVVDDSGTSSKANGYTFA